MSVFECEDISVETSAVGGRPAATSPRELAAAAQQLFIDQGFDETSVEDITAAVGVSRRTFFRYFPTKADVLWVESAAELKRFREELIAGNRTESYGDVLTRSIVRALTYPPEQHEWAFQRAQLVLTVPSVQAHSALRFAEWKDVAAAFAAERTGSARTDLLPVAVGHAVLAAMLAAHEYWVGGPGRQLIPSLHAALDLLLPKCPPSSAST